MYYIVTDKSPIYGKLQALRKKIKDANKAAFALAEANGFKEVRKARFSLAGGISAFGADKKPEGYAFAYGNSYPNDFLPKKINKNKELLKQIDDLPIVDYSEINDIVGFDEREHVKSGFWVMCPGFSFHKDFVLFEFSDKVNDKYKPVKGMKEILKSEHTKRYKMK